ncbi:MAG: DUF3014 domain-containing protein [Rhodanobacteraceae bacterium]|nr:DUF3014 domain-containing protein [Rhodanobacteraceae bacterium]MBK7043624.1 DUF3014 domain-containing protein [Rhodanobacteraceae bacterium]MBP9154596.1 DUF3014 domain-containing protein [Xanthomonadales bacterium]
MDDERNPLARMLILAGVLVGIGGGAWYVLQRPAVKPAAPAAVAVPIAPLVNDVRTPQYPVEAIMPPVATMPTAPLPDLFDSDGYVRDALNALFAHPQLAQWLVSEHLLARFVAFIDALPNRKVSSQLWPVKPATGSFFVQTEGDSTLIGPANSARYEAHAAALTGVDTAAAVALYVRLYPLLQQAYRELGYPQGHFNDRFVAVLDHLLAAPEPPAPVAVVRDDKGNWVYADADLESASAGHKLLMRMGAQHERAIKAKLREFRAALVSAKR